MKYLYKNKYWRLNKDYNLDKLLYLMIDRPDRNVCDSDFYWLDNKNQFYRKYDLPSYIWRIDSLNWVKNGKGHRENNKPSYIDYSGYKEYSINGQFLRREPL